MFSEMYRVIARNRPLINSPFFSFYPQIHGRLRAGGSAARPHRVHRGRLAGAADRERDRVPDAAAQGAHRAWDRPGDAVRARRRHLPPGPDEQGEFVSLLGKSQFIL